MKTILAAAVAAASVLTVTTTQAASPEVDALLKAAQQEGAVYSVGMPNTWANWVKTWSDLQTKYKIKTQDTDMASAEQISKFMAEGENAIGTVHRIDRSADHTVTCAKRTVGHAARDSDRRIGRNDPRVIAQRLSKRPRVRSKHNANHRVPLYYSNNEHMVPKSTPRKHAQQGAHRPKVGYGRGWVSQNARLAAPAADGCRSPNIEARS